MAGQLASLYYQAYGMAYDLAKATQKAYQYEKDTDETFIHFGHWDSLKKGLLAGEKLMLELNQMEKAYLEKDERVFEIEKNISLAQYHPQALLDLKEKGKCQFSFSELLFDVDFPGQYCRKIKAISLSIPAIVGPYENIKAVLRQTFDQTLIKPELTALKCLLGLSQEEPGTDVLRKQWRQQEQIALSTGVNDFGMFEINFRDERYLPFEGTGVVSDWELEMPKMSNRINFDTITDVIIHLKYTARYDGILKGLLQELDLKVPGTRFVSLSHEFLDEWHRLTQTGQTRVKISETMFPENFSDLTIGSLFMQIDFHEAPSQKGFCDLEGTDKAITFKDTTTQNLDLNTKIVISDIKEDEWGISIPDDLKQDVKDIGLILYYNGVVAWS